MNTYRNFLFIILVFFAYSCAPDQETVDPFKAYIAEFDPAYEYELMHTFSGDGYSGYVIRMVSQE